MESTRDMAIVYGKTSKCRKTGKRGRKLRIENISLWSSRKICLKGTEGVVLHVCPDALCRPMCIYGKLHQHLVYI